MSASQAQDWETDSAAADKPVGVLGVIARQHSGTVRASHLSPRRLLSCQAELLESREQGAEKVFGI